jgi:alkyl hydroperoxide reductase subunit AhpC
MFVVQKLAPDFSAKAVENGKILTLSRSDLLKSPSDPSKPGYALLLFYPLDFTFVCPTELTAYADRLEEFHGEGCRVVGVSVDSEYSHLQWTKQPRNLGGLFSESQGKFTIKIIDKRGKYFFRVQITFNIRFK